MSEHKKHKHSNGIVTSDDATTVKVARSGLNRTEKLIALLVVVVLVCAGGWYFFGKKSDPANTDTNVTQIDPLQVELKTAQNDLATAKQSGDEQQIAEAYTTLGESYLNTSQSQEAVNAYQKAYDAQTSKTPTEERVALANLGYAYAANGQTKKAIATLKKVVDMLQTENVPDRDMEIQSTQNNIDRLEAGKSL